SAAASRVAAIASACPSASGPSARHVALPRPSCNPSDTANSQPIAGLIPCTAPSSRIMTAGMLISGMALPSVRVRRSRRVRRGVATREPDLVRPVALLQLQQEALVERDAATRQHVELGHPAADAVRVELRVPRAV